MISGRRTGDVVRAFFALDLGPEARDACAAAVARLRAERDGEGVRWVAPANYHLTVRFLGNVEIERLEDLVRCVEDAVAPVAPFGFRLGAVHAFPSAHRPRVVAVEAAPADALAALAERVEVGVVAAGLDPERRRFRAHLTLGRVRGRRIPSLEGAEVADAPEVRVDELVLFRSDLAPDGSRYTMLERIRLGDPDCKPAEGRRAASRKPEARSEPQASEHDPAGAESDGECRAPTREVSPGRRNTGTGNP